MKLKKYLDSIISLVEKYPEVLEMEVIYCSDDEGNGFGKVIYEPSVMQMEDLSQHHLEEDRKSDKPNAVCIN